jgi:hypothetical protein
MLGADGGLDAFMANDEDGFDKAGRQRSARPRASKQRASAAGPASFSDAAALFAVKPGTTTTLGEHSDSDDSAAGMRAKMHNPYDAADSSGDSDVAVNRRSTAAATSAHKTASSAAAKQRSGKHSKKSTEEQIDDLLMSSDDDAASATSRRRRAHSSSSKSTKVVAGQTADSVAAPATLAIGMAVEARFGGGVSSYSM